MNQAKTLMRRNNVEKVWRHLGVHKATKFFEIDPHACAADTGDVGVEAMLVKSS